MNKKYFYSICTLFVISLIYSRFLVSVSMIAMVVLAIAHIRKESIPIGDFLKDKAYVGLTFVFLAVLFSGLVSEDTGQWVHQVKLKLPFLVLPFVFWVLKPVDRQLHAWVHIIFSAVVISSSFWVIGNFMADYKAISLSIGKGKSIPTPIDHIHYSIMVAYAIVSLCIMGILSPVKKVKWLFIGLGIYLFAFAHFLAVRTGLALSYGGIAVVLLWYIWKYKKYALGFGIGLSMLAIPYIAFHTIEPFKRKINYMYWDYAKYKQGKGKHYSDSERLMSYEVALDLIGEQPIIGHGVGDLRPLMIEKHKEKFGIKEKYIYPHNQYLYVLTTMGILGGLLFFGGLLSPLIFTRQRNIFLMILYLLMLMSFLVENTVQRAVITAFFLFFILLNASLRIDEKEDEKPEIFIG